MRILVAENDAVLRNRIKARLQQHDFLVDSAKSGLDVESALATKTYTAMVLGWSLSNCSGLDLLKRLRAKNNALPILMVAANDAVGDCIQCLDAGADDYMVNSFELGELVAYLRALIRRTCGKTDKAISTGALQLIPAQHAVYYRGSPIDLGGREFSLLQALMLNAGHVLSRTQIEASVYSNKREIGSNAIEVGIHQLRKKICANVVKTFHGYGYLTPKEIN